MGCWSGGGGPWGLGAVGAGGRAAAERVNLVATDGSSLLLHKVAFSVFCSRAALQSSGMGQLHDPAVKCTCNALHSTMAYIGIRRA